MKEFCTWKKREQVQAVFEEAQNHQRLCSVSSGYQSRHFVGKRLNHLIFVVVAYSLSVAEFMEIDLKFQCHFDGGDVQWPKCTFLAPG